MPRWSRSISLAANRHRDEKRRLRIVGRGNVSSGDARQFGRGYGAIVAVCEVAPVDEDVGIVQSARRGRDSEIGGIFARHGVDVKVGGSEEEVRFTTVAQKVYCADVVAVCQRRRDLVHAVLEASIISEHLRRCSESRRAEWRRLSRYCRRRRSRGSLRQRLPAREQRAH